MLAQKAQAAALRVILDLCVVRYEPLLLLCEHPESETVCIHLNRPLARPARPCFHPVAHRQRDWEPRANLLERYPKPLRRPLEVLATARARAAVQQERNLAHV